MTDPKGRLVKNPSGIIVDNETGLEWYVGPNVDISYHNAKKWVKKLNIDGKGWRLPNAAELGNLRYTGKYSIIVRGKEYTIKLHPLFKLGGCCPWTNRVHDSDGWSVHYVNFGFEEDYPWTIEKKIHDPNVATYPAEFGDNDNRVMAVRTRKLGSEAIK